MQLDNANQVVGYVVQAHEERSGSLGNHVGDAIEHFDGTDSELLHQLMDTYTEELDGDLGGRVATAVLESPDVDDSLASLVASQLHWTLVHLARDRADV